MRAIAADNYTYAETNYANPHALTAFFNGGGTTTYAMTRSGTSRRQAVRRQARSTGTIATA